MALKNLFDMVKADRYTQDGREALIKAQEAETEDKVYQIGEISQKTGLQKTANGWVKPKNGKQPGAKKQEKKGAGIPQATTETFVGKTYKDFVESATPSGYKPTKNTDNPDGSSTTVFEKEGKQLKVDFDKSGKITKVTPGESKPAEENPEVLRTKSKEAYKAAMKAPVGSVEWSNFMQESRDLELKANKLEKTNNANIEKVNKEKETLRKIQEENNKKEENRKKQKEQVKKVFEEYKKNNPDWKNKSQDEIFAEMGKLLRAQDAAPRVLTGDTRIRVRKA